MMTSGRCHVVLIVALVVLRGATAETDSEGSEEAARAVGKFLMSVREKDGIAGTLMRSLDRIGTSSGKEVDISDQCRAELDTWMGDIERREAYALKMRDSWATAEGGVLEGNVRWAGHFLECLDSQGRNVTPHYCTTYFGHRYAPGVKGIPIDLTFATCFPSACSNVTINEIVRESLQGHFWARRLLIQTDCHRPQDSKLNAFAYYVIVVGSIYVLSVIVCSLLDYRWSGQDVKSDQKQQQSNETNTTGRRLVRCFSLVRNGRKILSSKQGPGMITVLDGIRVISTFWVILGHSFDFTFTKLDNSVFAGDVLLSNAAVMPLINGTLSVDTFFCIGGLLSAYLLVRRVKRSNRMENPILLYLQRYLRLTPLMFFMLCIGAGLMKFMGSSPTWDKFAVEVDQACDKDWWTNLVYINNIYPTTNNCFLHTWYLACDMQFYLLAPLFVYLYWKHWSLGVSSVLLVLIGNLAATAKLAYDLPAMPGPVFYGYLFSFPVRLFMGRPKDESWDYKFHTDLYFVPWTRIGVYAIGMLAGFILFESRMRMRMSKTVALIGWTLATGTGLSVVYATWVNVVDPLTLTASTDAFYAAVSRPAWAMCVAWVILACTWGYGGPVNSFLSWRAFVPLSKLTFGAYLVHPMIIFVFVHMQENFLHFSLTTFSYYFIGHVVVSFMLAFVFALIIEWPTQELVRMVLPSSSSSSSRKTPASSSIPRPDDRGRSSTAAEEKERNREDHENPAFTEKTEL